MRTILTIIVFTGIHFYGYAQNPDKISFGFGTGLDISNVSYQAPMGTANTYSVNGFRSYVFVDLPVGDNLFVQPELAYDGMGWQYLDDSIHAAGQSGYVKTSMNFLTLAILPKYKIGKTGLALYVGAAYGFLLSATLKGFGSETYNNKNSYNDGILEWIGGAEYYLPMGLGCSARYTGGISNLLYGVVTGVTMHNYAFSISLEYKFK
jgi:hypothetical protein